MKKLFAFIVLITYFISTPAFSQSVDISSVPADDILVMDIDYVTGQGQVVIIMRSQSAPNHVARIKELAREGFYDGIIFHRVSHIGSRGTPAMAQTGDPTGTGTGGSGKNLDAEFNRIPHMRGTLSMARGDEDNSADSQFFICYDRLPGLDDKYTVWGRVVRGMEFVDLLPEGVPPAKPGKIVKMRIASDIDGWPNNK